MRMLMGFANFIVLIWLSACASGDPAVPQPDTLRNGSDTARAAPVRPDGSFDEDTRILAPDFQPIRVGILLPLSGPAADVGTAMRDAAALALFDAYDPRLQLVPFDTEGTKEGAELAAQAAIKEGVSIVLGPLLAQSIEAAGPVLQAENIPLLGFSNNIEVADTGLYLMGFMPDQEVDHIIRYAAAKGLARMAGLIPRSAYGERVMQSFGPAVRDAGAELVALSRYEPNANLLAEPVKRIARYDERRAAYRAEIEALRALGDDLSLEIVDRLENRETLGAPGYDAILIAQGDPLIRSLAPLLPYYEVDPDEVRFLGTGLWDEPSLSREPPMRGAWFPAPEPEMPRAFLKRFAESYNREAPRIATLAYDAMALVATLARNPIAEQRFSRAALEDPAGFVGIDGAFRLRADGIVERRLAILEITRRGLIVEQMARKSFQPGPIGSLLGASPASGR